MNKRSVWGKVVGNDINDAYMVTSLSPNSIEVDAFKGEDSNYTLEAKLPGTPATQVYKIHRTAMNSNVFEILNPIKKKKDQEASV